MHSSLDSSLDSVKQKKTYSQLHSSPFSDHLKPSTAPSHGNKKIIPTIAHSGLREDFKKMFLPLLIDIFELRQMLETYKMHKQSPEFRHLGKVSKTPEEIVFQLKQMQLEIEESQRWCEGVIGQIAKGIKEAQETLDYLQKKPLVSPPIFCKGRFSLKFLLLKFKALLWKKK